MHKVSYIDTRYPVIKEVAQENKWLLTFSKDIDYWDIMWSDGHFRDGFLKTLKPYQKINHFPKMT